jgi:hypothetical protein
MMTFRAQDDKVGYGRPPRHSQWKKGQSGNPRRRYNRVPKGVVELIDTQFAKEIVIIENRTKRRVSVLEAILLQLWRKEMSGDRHASRVRLKYQKVAASKAGSPMIIVQGEVPDRSPESGPQEEEPLP